MRDIQQGILRHYGIQYQLRQMQEEASELVTAVNHFFRQKISQDSLIDEIADVEIMIDQMRIYFGDKEIDEKKTHKLTRARDRIKVREFEQAVKAG